MSLHHSYKFYEFQFYDFIFGITFRGQRLSNIFTWFDSWSHWCFDTWIYMTSCNSLTLICLIILQKMRVIEREGGTARFVIWDFRKNELCTRSLPSSNNYLLLTLSREHASEEFKARYRHFPKRRGLRASLRNSWTVSLKIYFIGNCLYPFVIVQFNLDLLPIEGHNCSEFRNTAFLLWCSKYYS